MLGFEISVVPVSGETGVERVFHGGQILRREAHGIDDGGASRNACR